MEYTLSGEVKDIVFMYSAQIKDSKIFFAPNIPEKKLSNAVQSYATIGDDEEPLALVDNTSLGSAEEGLLLTNRRIYSCGSDGKQHCFALQEIQSITFKPSWLAGALTKVSVNDTLLLGGIIPSNTVMEQFCQMLREIATAVGSDIATEFPIEAAESSSKLLKQGDTKGDVRKPRRALKESKAKQAVAEWRNKAKAFIKEGKVEEALECYDRALEIRGEEEDLLESRGNLLRKLGRFDEAMQCYNKLTSNWTWIVLCIMSFSIAYLMGLLLDWLPEPAYDSPQRFGYYLVSFPICCIGLSAIGGFFVSVYRIGKGLRRFFIKREIEKRLRDKG